MGSVDNDLHVGGSLVPLRFYPPAGCITDAAIVTSAGIQSSKVVHRAPWEFDIQKGTTVTAQDTILHIAAAAGNVLGLQAVSTGTAPSGDHTITIDLKKSTAGGAFASILSSTLVINSGNTVRVATSATLGAGVAFVAGDLFELTVAVAGSTSSQGTGLHITVTNEETPA